MNWEEALEIVMRYSKHEPFRDKCSDSNSNIKERNTFRSFMLQMASQLELGGIPSPIAPSETSFFFKDLEEKPKPVRVGGIITIQPGSIPLDQFMKIAKPTILYDSRSDQRPPPKITDVQPIQATQAIQAIQGAHGQIVKIPTIEMIKLVHEINSCEHHHNDFPCGCGMSRCRIGKQGKSDPVHGGTLVSLWNCAHCLHPENEMYKKQLNVGT